MDTIETQGNKIYKTEEGVFKHKIEGLTGSHALNVLSHVADRE